jgi:histidinol-phosphatase (PHP family)
MQYFNLHTHSRFCDGKEEPEAYVKQAIDLGFHTLGFSSHAPVPFENTFALKEEQMKDYFSTIVNLKEKFRDQIKLLLSLEIDYIPGITRDFRDFRKAGNLDYTIGGVHLVREPGIDALWFIDGSKQETYDTGLQLLYKGNARIGVEAYYRQIMEMVATQRPNLVAHLDKIKMHNKNRFFTEEESWYKDMVWKTLKFIADESDCILEVNTRGLYKQRSDTYFPSPAVLEQIHHLKIPVTISTDAHHPDELSLYIPEATAMLKEIGFRELVYFEGKTRQKQKI